MVAMVLCLRTTVSTYGGTAKWNGINLTSSSPSLGPSRSQSHSCRPGLVLATKAAPIAITHDGNLSAPSVHRCFGELSLRGKG